MTPCSLARFYIVLSLAFMLSCRLVGTACADTDPWCHPALFAVALRPSVRAFVGNANGLHVMRYSRETSSLERTHHAGGDCSNSVWVHPGGEFVYCTGPQGPNRFLRAFATSGGALTFLEEHDLGSTVNAAILPSPRSDFLVTSPDTINKLRLYAIDPSSGRLTLTHETAAGLGGAAGTLSRDGRSIYVRVPTLSIMANRIEGSLIANVQNLGNPGTNTFSFSVSPDGSRLLYNMNATPGLRMHTINPDGTVGASEDTGPNNQIFDNYSWTPDGSFLYYRTGTSIGGWSYRDGSLTAIPGLPLNLGFAITPVVDPAGRFLFCETTSSYFVFEINPADGGLAQLPDSPRTTSAPGRPYFHARSTLFGI